LRVTADGIIEPTAFDVDVRLWLSSTLRSSAAANGQQWALLPGVEVVAFVVDDEEGWKVFYIYPKDGFHSKLSVLQDFDSLDAVLRKARCGSSD
jgi:hypothetical protein